MMITLLAVTPYFAAAIGEVDRSRPLTATEVDESKKAFWRYAVLTFPRQALSEQQPVAFAQHL